MTSALTTLAGQWAGMLKLGGQGEFVRLIVNEGNATLDLPLHKLFRCPLEPIAPSTFTVTGLPEALQLVFGTLQDDVIEVAVTQSSLQGNLHLRRVILLDSGDFADFIGHYQVEAGRSFLISRTYQFEEWLYFYLADDQIVRLYPLAAHEFLSEAGETFVFEEGSLLYQPYAGERVTAKKGSLYDEQRIQFASGDHTIGGTLLTPLGVAPYPAVILCHGADTHYRDWYRVFAQEFVRQGIAAFIYDKRGWGNSTGEPLHSEIMALADDAEAAYGFLQNRADIDKNGIGFWGFSNGGWVGPIVASRVENPAFVIIMSGAGVTPARQEQIRRTNVIRELGANEEQVALIHQLWAHIYKLFVHGQWSEELGALLVRVNEDSALQNLPKREGHGPWLQPVPPVMSLEEWRENAGALPDMGFDPAPLLANLACPLLCLWGENDTVLPVQESYERLRHALKDHTDTTLELIPKATHKLALKTAAPTGMLPEQAESYLHDFHYVPGVLQKMAVWASERVGKSAK